MFLALLIQVIFSIGSIDALIPIILILIILVAAAGVNRGFNLFNLFGIATLAGINPGGKSSIAGKTGFGVIMYAFPPAGQMPAGAGKRAAARVKSGVKRGITNMTGALARKTGRTIYGTPHNKARHLADDAINRRLKADELAAAQARTQGVSQARSGSAYSRGNRSGEPQSVNQLNKRLGRARSAQKGESGENIVALGSIGTMGTAVRRVVQTNAAGKPVKGMAVSEEARVQKRHGGEFFPRSPSEKQNRQNIKAEREQAQAERKGMQADHTFDQKPKTPQTPKTEEKGGVRRTIWKGVKKAARGGAEVGKVLIRIPVTPMDVARDAKKLASRGIRAGAKKVGGGVGKLENMKTQGKIGKTIVRGTAKAAGATARGVARFGKGAKRLYNSEKVFQIKGIPIISMKSIRGEIHSARQKLVKGSGLGDAAKTVAFVAVPGLYLANRVIKARRKIKENREELRSGDRWDAARNRTDELLDEHIKTNGPRPTNEKDAKKWDAEFRKIVAKDLSQRGGILDSTPGFRPERPNPTIFTTAPAALWRTGRNIIAGAQGRTERGAQTTRGVRGAWKGFTESAREGAANFGRVEKATPADRLKKKMAMEEARKELNAALAAANGDRRDSRVIRARDKFNAARREHELASRPSAESTTILSHSAGVVAGMVAMNKRTLFGSNTEHTKQLREDSKIAAERFAAAHADAKAAQKAASEADKRVKDAEAALERAKEAHEKNRNTDTELAWALAGGALASATAYAAATNSYAKQKANERRDAQEASRMAHSDYTFAQKHAPFKNRFIDRAVVEHKQAILKHSINSEALEQQRNNAERIIEHEKDKQQRINEELVDSRVATEKLRKELDEERSELEQARKERTPATTHLSDVLSDVKKATEMNMAAGRTVDARAVSSAEERLRVAKEKYDQALSDYTAKLKETEEAEAKYNEKKKEKDISETKVNLYHGLQNTIAGNRSTYHDTREGMSNTVIKEEDTERLREEHENAERALMAQPEGHPDEDELKKTAYKAEIAEKAAYDEQKRAAEIRKTVAAASQNFVEARKFLDDPDPEVRAAALTSPAFSNAEELKRKQVRDKINEMATDDRVQKAKEDRDKAQEVVDKAKAEAKDAALNEKAREAAKRIQEAAEADVERRKQRYKATVNESKIANTLIKDWRQNVSTSEVHHHAEEEADAAEAEHEGGHEPSPPPTGPGGGI